MRVRLGDVLGAQAEQQLAVADVRAVARGALRRHRERQPVAEPDAASSPPAVSSRHGMKFIAGEPMKPATKRVLGDVIELVAASRPARSRRGSSPPPGRRASSPRPGRG